MNQLRKRSSKVLHSVIAVMLMFSMIAASAAVMPGTASAKKVKVSSVKMISKTMVVAPGKTLKLKPEVKVSPNKAANKKVTYKSDNPKVLTVSKKGVVKAKGKAGSKAKITITSKKNKKKKTVVTVKIGTPVKSIKMKPKTLKLEERKNGKVLKVKYSPKKATLKKVKWKSSNKKVATVNSYGVVIPVGGGKATITATAKDGSNKKAKCKVSVKGYIPPTLPPTPKPDPRRRTMVENFEKYPIGHKWKTTTANFPNAAIATVQKDPTNPNNKVLKLDYNGTQQAFDFAPIFTINLASLPNVKEVSDDPKLDDFVGFTFKTKVESNAADCQYKGIKAYFDKPNHLNEKYYFASSSATVKGLEEEMKYKIETPMAEGPSTEFAVDGKKDSYKNFPMYYTGYPGDKNAVSPGFSGAQNDKTVKFVDKFIDFKKGNMKDPIDTNLKILELKEFDMVFGSTYEGNYKARGLFTNVYIDDVQLLSNSTTVPLKGLDIKLTNNSNSVGIGLNRYVRPVMIPADSTQTAVEWSTTTEDILKIVDKDSGIISGVKEGTGKLTVTSKINPAISKTIDITVFPVGTATEDLDLLPIATFLPTDNADTKRRSDAEYEYDPADGLWIKYKATDESLILDLGKEMDFTKYNALEISGQTPGSVAVELYSSGFDKTADLWWEKTEGGEYPFFNGSCGERTDRGTYFSTFGDRSLETDIFGWNNFADSDQRGGDFTKIRYILLKSNNAPVHPAGFLEDGLDEKEQARRKYLIKSLRLTLKEEPITETDIVVSERNEALGTKNADPAVYTEGTYAEDGISFKSNSRDGSGMAFYLNDIKEGVTPPSDGAYKPKDISGYSYIKVAVECTSAIALVGLEDGSDWTSAAKATGAWEKESNPNSVRVKDRILFFRISNRDRTAIDAIGIKATVPNAVVKVKSMQLIRRPPEIMPDEEATMFLAVNPS